MARPLPLISLLGWPEVPSPIDYVHNYPDRRAKSDLECRRRVVVPTQNDLRTFRVLTCPRTYGIYEIATLTYHIEALKAIDKALMIEDFCIFRKRMLKQLIAHELSLI